MTEAICWRMNRLGKSSFAIMTIVSSRLKASAGELAWTVVIEPSTPVPIACNMSSIVITRSCSGMKRERQLSSDHAHVCFLADPGRAGYWFRQQHHDTARRRCVGADLHCVHSGPAKTEGIEGRLVLKRRDRPNFSTALRCSSLAATEFLCQLDEDIAAGDHVFSDHIFAHAVKPGAAWTEYNRRNTGVAKDCSVGPKNHTAAHGGFCLFCERGFDHLGQDVPGRSQIRRPRKEKSS